MKCDGYSVRAMWYGLLLLRVSQFVSGFIRVLSRFTTIVGRLLESELPSSKDAQQKYGYRSFRNLVSPYVLTKCCNAPMWPDYQFDQARFYIRCSKCLIHLDYADNEMVELLDRYADEEFIISQPIFNLDGKHLYPRGTVQERIAYWQQTLYQIQLHERVSGDLRDPKRFINIITNLSI